MSLAGVAAALVVAFPAHSGDSPSCPHRVTRPADGVTCFSPGLETTPIPFCVVETDTGLVLIDTGFSPTMAGRVRTRIAAELGRDDFRWVINTHGHFDHTGGNQVFADSLIIGHDNVPGEMQSFSAERDAWIERRHGYLDRQRAAADGALPGSAEERAFEETLRFDHELIADLGVGYRSTPPTVTFSDRLTLTAGDLEVRLIWMGPAHTDSDILVHIPNLGVVFSGDLFAPEFLGVAFYSSPIDPDRWLEALDATLDNDLKVIVGGHGFVLTPEWIKTQRRYLGEVWREVKKARARGESLNELESRFAFDERFAEIAEILGTPNDDLAARHAQIVSDFWNADN